LRSKIGDLKLKMNNTLKNTAKNSTENLFRSVETSRKEDCVVSN